MEHFKCFKNAYFFNLKVAVEHKLPFPLAIFIELKPILKTVKIKPHKHKTNLELKCTHMFRSRIYCQCRHSAESCSEVVPCFYLQTNI